MFMICCLKMVIFWNFWWLSKFFRSCLENNVLRENGLVSRRCMDIWIKYVLANGIWRPFEMSDGLKRPTSVGDSVSGASSISELHAEGERMSMSRISDSLMSKPLNPFDISKPSFACLACQLGSALVAEDGWEVVCGGCYPARLSCHFMFSALSIAIDLCQ